MLAGVTRVSILRLAGLAMALAALPPAAAFADPPRAPRPLDYLVAAMARCGSPEYRIVPERMTALTESATSLGGSMVIALQEQERRLVESEPPPPPPPPPLPAPTPVQPPDGDQPDRYAEAEEEEPAIDPACQALYVNFGPGGRKIAGLIIIER